MNRLQYALCGLLLFALMLQARQSQGDDKQVQQDLAAFRAFLDKQYAGKKWQTGPTRLESKAIQGAYDKRRFYFVFSAPPLPPGAPRKDILEAYKKRVEEFNRDYIALVVSIDEKGKIELLKSVADYNRGLRAIKTDDEARQAALAVLSLYHSGRVGPEAVPDDHVTLNRGGPGWTIAVKKKNHYQGQVVIDKQGQVKAMSKSYIGPLPP